MESRPRYPDFVAHCRCRMGVKRCCLKRNRSYAPCECPVVAENSFLRHGFLPRLGIGRNTLASITELSSAVPKLYPHPGAVMLLWLAEYRVWLTAAGKRQLCELPATFRDQFARFERVGKARARSGSVRLYPRRASEVDCSRAA